MQGDKKWDHKFSGPRKLMVPLSGPGISGVIWALSGPLSGPGELVVPLSGPLVVPEN